MFDLSNFINRFLVEKVRFLFRQDRARRQIRADRRQLEQAIMNVLVNAQDDMPNGGDVTIETTLSELKNRWSVTGSALLRMRMFLLK